MRRSSKRTQRPTRIAILSDTHHPDHEHPFWSATLRLLADERPDEIILNGDFGEYSSGSRHTPDAFKAAYEDDVRSVRAALRQLRAACPRARITWLEGNHENMVPRMLSMLTPSMLKGFWERWARDHDFEHLGIKWVPEMQQPVRRGKLRVLHGHQIPGKQLPKYHAARIADLYGAPGLHVVFGHSHRPQTYVRPSKEGDATAYALGCGRTLDPSWMKGSVGGWRNEIAIAYVRSNGDASVYPVRWEGGALVWNGKVYA